MRVAETMHQATTTLLTTMKKQGTSSLQTSLRENYELMVKEQGFTEAKIQAMCGRGW